MDLGKIYDILPVELWQLIWQIKGEELIISIPLFDQNRENQNKARVCLNKILEYQASLHLTARETAILVMYIGDVIFKQLNNINTISSIRNYIQKEWTGHYSVYKRCIFIHMRHYKDMDRFLCATSYINQAVEHIVHTEMLFKCEQVIKQCISYIKFIIMFSYRSPPYKHPEFLSWTADLLEFIQGGWRTNEDYKNYFLKLHTNDLCL